MNMFINFDIDDFSIDNFQFELQTQIVCHIEFCELCFTSQILIKIQTTNPKMPKDDLIKFHFQQIQADSQLCEFYQIANHDKRSIQQEQQQYYPEIENDSQKAPDNFSSSSSYKKQAYSQRCFKINKEKNSSKVVNKMEKNSKKFRTKMYINMLQTKIQGLQQKIQKLESINQANQEYLKKISVPEQIINGFFVGKTHIYQRLQSLIEKPQNQETRKEIIKQITTLRLRSGVNGKDRIKAINYYFKQLLELQLPELQKYLIYAAANNIDFFNREFVEKVNRNVNHTFLSSQQKWKYELIRDLELDSTRMLSFEAFQGLIKQQKITFDELVLKFYNAKQQMCAQAKKIEDLFDTFRGILSPFQLSKILVNIQKNKYRKQISAQTIESFWAYQFQNEELKKGYSEKPLGQSWQS